MGVARHRCQSIFCPKAQGRCYTRVCDQFGRHCCTGPFKIRRARAKQSPEAIMRKSVGPDVNKDDDKNGVEGKVGKVLEKVASACDRAEHLRVLAAALDLDASMAHRRHEFMRKHGSEVYIAVLAVAACHFERHEPRLLQRAATTLSLSYSTLTAAYALFLASYGESAARKGA